MLDDSWRMDYRSLDSDGKEGVSMQFREDKKNTRKIWKHIILPEDEGSQKEGRSWASGGPHPLGAGPPDPVPRAGVAHLTPPPTPPLCLYLPYGTLIPGE